MSKHKEKTPAPLADWEVAMSYEHGSVTVTQARWKRDEMGGYTFTGKDGPSWDFAPAVVAGYRPGAKRQG